MTDESTLRSALASLDDPSSSLHWWLGFWTFLVALGVVLEVVFVVWEYWDELRDFKQGTIHPPERPHTILFVLGLLGAGLVAAGVSGELWEDSQIAKLETCIRKGDDALFLLLSKEAGDAATSAKSAHAEADAVKGIAGEAREDAKDALAKAQAAQAVSGKALNESNKATTSALHALGLARTTEENVEWRRLTKAQQKEIGERLKPFHVQGAYVECLASDQEAVSFSSDLVEALRGANWRVPDVMAQDQLLEGGISKSRWPGNVLDHGILIVSSSDLTSHNAAAALLDELHNRFGFDASRRPDDNTGNSFNTTYLSTIEIKVEPRPAGPQGAAKLRDEAQKKK